MPKLLSILLLTIGLTVGNLANVFAQVENGKLAPDFTLADSNGNQVSLSQFKGKFVVLERLNYDCPFVMKHYNLGNKQN